MSTRKASAPRRRFLAGAAALLLAPPAWPEEPSFDGIGYRVITPGTPDSALEVARRMLEHLVQGDIASAARLSNAPERREQVLRDYLASVGEAEFRQVFSLYAAAPLAAEVAVGEHRLLIWDLPGADRNVAGQYFVRRDATFVVDDAPGGERARLQRLLRAYREGKFRPSAGTG